MSYQEDPMGPAGFSEVGESLEEATADRIFEMNPVMMSLSLLPERTFVRVNHSFLAVLGFTREQVIGHTAMDLGIFADPASLEQSRQILERNGNMRNLEVPFFTSRGELRHGLFSGEIISLRGRNYLLSAMQDVTERKETALRLSLATRAGGVGVWEYRVAENRIYWDDQMHVLYGLAPGTFPGIYESWVQGLHPHDRSRCMDEIEQALRGGKEFQTRFRTLWPDGSVHHIRAMAMVLRDPSGRPLRMIGTNWDITGQVESQQLLEHREAALRDSLAQVEMFRSLIDSSGDCFYMVDMDEGGRMSYANHAALRHFGTTREDLYTWHIPDWDPEFPPHRIPELLETIEKAGSMRLESRHRVADGSTVPVDITVNFLRDGSGHRYAYGWFTNIQDRLAAEAELKKAKDDAEEANRAKSEFLANMSHELRTPLNGVIGFMDLLSGTPLSDIQKKYVDTARSSGRALLEIINDILDFSKIEAGMLEMDPVPSDLPTLFGESIEMVRPAADGKNLQVRLDLDPRMPRTAVVDPVRIRQILANLLGNAVKFTHEGEVKLEVKCLAFSEDRCTCRITVRDTGIGIRKDQMTRLFKAFSQADSSTTRIFGGTGLGLVISESLVRRMGSRIDVESTPGIGTVFGFDLVMQVALDPVDGMPGVPSAGGSHVSATFSPQASGTEKPGTSPSGARILVAEDVALNLFLVKSLLTRILPDALIVEARDGAEALAAWEQMQPDLVLMDVQMPVMDGLDAVRAIRAREESGGLTRVPVIALTAGAFQEEERRCREAGMDDFVAKPIDFDHLREVVEHLLSRG